MNKDQILAKLKANIEKLKLINFRLVTGGDLILFLGRDQASGTSGDKSFWIESAWRICENKKLLGGSLDEESALPILRSLQGKHLESVTLKEYGDLMIYFEGGVVIESFIRSLDDEQWELREKDGVRIGLGKHLKFFMKKVNPDEM